MEILLRHSSKFLFKMVLFQTVLILWKDTTENIRNHLLRISMLDCHSMFQKPCCPCCGIPKLKPLSGFRCWRLSSPSVDISADISISNNMSGMLFQLFSCRVYPIVVIFLDVKRKGRLFCSCRFIW